MTAIRRPPPSDADPGLPREGSGRALAAFLGLVVAIALSDSLIGGRLVLLGYLSLPAVIGSAFLGPRRTAASVGVRSSPPSSPRFRTASSEPPTTIRVTIIAAVSTVSVFLARLRLARETQLRQVT